MIYYFNIDAYYIFREFINVDEISNININTKYSLYIISSCDDAYFDRLVSFWGKAYKKKYEHSSSCIRKMFQRGDVCVLAICCDEIVGMGWVGTKNAIKDISFASYIKKEKNVSIGHHSFVDIEHRGEKIQRFVTCERMRVAKEKGSDVFYVFVGIKNIASVINSMRTLSEFKPIIHVQFDLPFFSLNCFPGASKENWVKI